MHAPFFISLIPPYHQHPESGAPRHPHRFLPSSRKDDPLPGWAMPMSHVLAGVKYQYSAPALAHSRGTGMECCWNGNDARGFSTFPAFSFVTSPIRGQGGFWGLTPTRGTAYPALNPVLASLGDGVISGARPRHLARNLRNEGHPNGFGMG